MLDQLLIIGYFLTYILINQEVVFTDMTVKIDLNLTLELVNPSDGSASIITENVTSFYPNDPRFDYRTLGYNSQQTEFYADILEPITIPAGYRLKASAMYRFDKIPSGGSIMIRTGAPWNGGGSGVSWNIQDIDYSNEYTIANISDIFGVQVNMRSDTYPDISVFGVTNNTVYNSAETITIDVTDNTDSYYRWDGGSWIKFDNDTQIDFPDSSWGDPHGWHYLEINATETEFNNTRINLYELGYDNSNVNVVLHSPYNGSLSSHTAGRCRTHCPHGRTG